MTGIVALDIGDVLIHTHPDAHYQALAEVLGVPWPQVRTAVEDSGLAQEFELIPRTARCCLYVDDLPENVAAARAAGLPTAHHTDPRATAVRLAAIATLSDA